MKILIVSTFFPPQNSIASLRPYSWAKYWSQMGHEVTVLTTAKEKQDNDLNYDLSNFRVISFPMCKPFCKHHKAVVSEKKVNNVGVTNNYIYLHIKKLYVSFIMKSGCFIGCRFPDWHDSWAKIAIKFLKKEKIKWDIVISTAGPYSVHRVAYFLKKKYYTKIWISDWRDLWTDSHLFKGIKIFHPYEKWLESKFNRAADYITTVSDGLATTLAEKTRKKITVIYNGYDEDFFDSIKKTKRKFYEKVTISYTGTLYKKYQDIEPLLQAMRELYLEGVLSPIKLEVVSLGANCDMTELFKQYGLSEFYTYKGFLPQERAHEIQYNSDVSLFLDYTNSNAKGILTGKLFEYLYISQMIWSIGGSLDSDANNIIKKCNAGICLGKDVPVIKAELIKLTGNRETYCSLEKKYEEINKYDRKIQAQKMCDLFSDNL